MRPTVYIFSLKQCLVVPYINPADQDPGVQTVHTPGESFVYIALYSKGTLKNLLLWKDEAQR